jgi:hypothetical protein
MVHDLAFELDCNLTNITGYLDVWAAGCEGTTCSAQELHKRSHADGTIVSYLKNVVSHLKNDGQRAGMYPVY